MASAFVLLAASGCNVPSNTPTGYDDAVKASFIEGCTGDIPETGGTTTTLAAADFCGCAYEVFADLVPYNDDARTDSVFSGYPADAPTFTKFNDELGKSDDPGAVWATLPESVRQELDRCPLGSGPLAPTTTAGPATTSTATP